MEAAPPSYEKATLINHWDIIAHYIASSDLCAASLVCSAWHATFGPQIWGNPASHFGIENDRVYVALTRFKRTLQTARLLVRSMTHTLHLPPAHAELYDGPHADWLREILERLPNLQSLIVRGLPFFDHAALQALRYVKTQRPEHAAPEGVVELPAASVRLPVASVLGRSGLSLRLLDCSRCANVTAHELAQALGRFENLLYLDLSFTYPAKQLEVLAVLRRLQGLQVLKLRSIGLTDVALYTLANAIGWSVRSLDVRDNLLTDRGVRTLLDHCFALEGAGSDPLPAGVRSPALLPYLGSEMLEIYQGEDFDGYLRNAFTDKFVSRLAIEDAPDRGITHLYIAGNNISVEGAGGLIRSGRLHVLDLGFVNRDLTSLSMNGHVGAGQIDRPMPGAEKLVPILAKHAAGTLNLLRIEHDIVTEENTSSSPTGIVRGRFELADTALPDLPHHAAEVHGTSAQYEAFELSADQSPRAELSGDPLVTLVSPIVRDSSSKTNDEEDDDRPAQPRRGSALAPEVVPIEALAATLSQSNLISPCSALDEESAGLGFPPFSPISTLLSTPQHTPTTRSTLESDGFPILTGERQARVMKHTSDNHNLHPAMLPHVKSLVLTNVPSFSSNRAVSDRLIDFIKHCAVERFSAQRQARLDYSVPPGREGHAAALKHSARRVFGLQRLVLEIENEEAARHRSSKSSPWQHWATKSMTGDRDSEALWSAAETDFSFFGDGEECGLPNHEPGQSSFPSMSEEKQVVIEKSLVSEEPPPVPPPKFDTVALLSKFRQERRLARERQAAAGAIDPETEGYWDGVVQVVRPAVGLRRDEALDYYGNRFEAGWLYR